MFEKLFSRDPAAGRHGKIPDAERKQKQEAAYQRMPKQTAPRHLAKSHKIAEAAAKAAPAFKVIGTEFKEVRPNPAATMRAVATGMENAPGALKARDERRTMAARDEAAEERKKVQVQEQLKVERAARGQTPAQERQPGRHRRS